MRSRGNGELSDGRNPESLIYKGNCEDFHFEDACVRETGSAAYNGDVLRNDPDFDLRHEVSRWNRDAIEK